MNIWKKRNYGKYILIFLSFIFTLVIFNFSIFRKFDFEYIAILTIFIAVVGPFPSIWAVSELKQRKQKTKNPILYVLKNATVAHIVMIAVSSVPVLIAGSIKGGCNLSYNFLFFLLLPIITAFYTISSGMLLAFITNKSCKAYLLYTGFSLFIFLFKIRFIIKEPPIYFFNSVAGYFPGPLYDEAIFIMQPLVYARLATVLMSLGFLIIAALLLDQQLLRLHISRLYVVLSDIQKQILLFLFVITSGFWLLLFAHSDTLGMMHPRSYIQKALGGTYDSKHCTFYYDTSIAKSHVIFRGDECDFNFDQHKQFFNSSPIKRVPVYIYKSAEQKKRLIGAGDTSYADIFNGEIHINYNNAIIHSVLKHEMSHVFSKDDLSYFDFNIGILEGIAVAADWKNYPIDPHQSVAVMKKMDVLPSLDTIFSLSFWGGSGAKSYAAAGSFIAWLHSNYGNNMLAKLLKSGNISEAVGEELSGLEKKWLDYIDKTVVLTENQYKIGVRRFSKKSLFERKCPHEVARLKKKAYGAMSQNNYVAAASYFDAALECDAERSDVRKAKVYAALKSGNIRDAEMLISHYLSDENTTTPDKWFYKNMKGDILISKGEFASAEKLFRSLLTENDTVAERRIYQIKLLLLHEEELEPYLPDIFDKTESNMLLYRYTELQKLYPHIPEIHYIIGNILLQKKQFKDALRNLSAAASFGVKDVFFQAEIQKLIGITAYFSGDFEAAQNAFDVLEKEFEKQEYPHDFTYWKKRIKWKVALIGKRAKIIL